MTPILDEKTSFNGYYPRNYNDLYYGSVSAKTALSKSLNTCAVKLLNSVGIEKAKNYLKPYSSKKNSGIINNKPQKFDLFIYNIEVGSRYVINKICSNKSYYGDDVRIEYINGKTGQTAFAEAGFEFAPESPTNQQFFELDNALEIAEKTYVNVNIHQKENAAKLNSLACLPDSCEASADCLESQRAVFEKHNVFSPAMIDGIIKRLRSYGDRTLRADIGGNQEEMLKLVNRYFHCG